QHVPRRWGIVDHLDDAIDAGMHECTVAQYTHHTLSLFRRKHMTKPKPNAYRGAHANRGVDAIKRRQRAQPITADVAGDNALHISENFKCAAVRAAGA